MRPDQYRPGGNVQGSELGTPLTGAGGAPPPPATTTTAAGAPKSTLLTAAVFSALFLVQLSNASYGVITKVALHGKGGVNPLVFSLFRDALSFPLLEAIAIGVDGFRLPAAGDVGRFFCLGVFGMFGNQFFYILGLVYIDAGLASVLNLLTPVFSFVFATAIGLDRFSWPQAAGVMVAVFGAMVFIGLFDPATYSKHHADGGGSGGSGSGADLGAGGGGGGG
eukprot:SAG22_NODE_6130_length_895_cov_1.040201_1_plen_221_part_10